MGRPPTRAATRPPTGDTVAHGDRLAWCLGRVCDALEAAGLWYTLAYGTLLGAVRGGDVIPWDHDFDLLVRSDEVAGVLALRPRLRRHAITLRPTRKSGAELALNPAGIAAFWSGAIGVRHAGRKVGDLFAFQPFADGVLRRVDLATGAYWCPHSSFPGYFVESRATAAIRGRVCAVPGQAERWLEATYGEDWRVPYRAVIDGGAGRPGVTIHGDRYEPTLAAQRAWSLARGWDPGPYATAAPWPRAIGGAGPRGPTERTRGNSDSLWWRDLDELVAHH